MYITPCCDILYLASNRYEFTYFSLCKLLDNTNWGLVGTITLYDDNSTDGTQHLVDSITSDIERTGTRVEVRHTNLGGPVAVMQHYIDNSGGCKIDACNVDLPLFAKIDNDVVVAPQWLDKAVEVMYSKDGPDILGIEPPLSRKRPHGHSGQPLINPEELVPGPARWVAADSIGGVGLMWHNAFRNRPRLRQHHTYGGFTEWQQSQHARHDLRIGWLVPPVNNFLLDRLPIEPWVSLSRMYIERGWQRPWGNYTAQDSELWSWCDDVNKQVLSTAALT